MENIEVGDIVNVYGQEEILYIVLEVEDFSDDGIEDVDFKLAKLYPPSNRLVVSTEGIDDVSLFEKRGTDSYNRKMEILRKDREIKGWDEAKYISIIEKSLNNKDESNQSTEVLDEICYSYIETIDECLDAINNLDFLYSKFGGKEYIENKKLVLNRLVKLTESNEVSK